MIDEEVFRLSQRFTKFWLRGEEYKIGDSVFLKDAEDQRLVGKIKMIIPNGGIKDYTQHPCVKVQWYYKKQDLDLIEAGVSKFDLQYVTD